MSLRSSRLMLLFLEPRRTSCYRARKGPRTTPRTRQVRLFVGPWVCWLWSGWLAVVHRGAWGVVGFSEVSGHSAAQNSSLLPGAESPHPLAQLSRLLPVTQIVGLRVQTLLLHQGKVGREYICSVAWEVFRYSLAIGNQIWTARDACCWRGLCLQHVNWAEGLQ